MQPREPAEPERAGQDLPVDPSTAAAKGDQPEIIESNQEKQAPADQSAAKGENRFSCGFQSAPCDSFLRGFADKANLALQMDVVPPGTLSYYDPAPHTVTEWLDILNSQLLQKGFLLVRRDRFVIVVESKGIPSGLIPQVPVSELEHFGWNEPLTVVFPVVNMDLTKAASDLKGLISSWGKITPLPGSNRVMVTDTGGNLRRVRDYLSADKADPAQRMIMSFPLKRTNAVEVAKALNDLLASQRQPKESGPSTPGRAEQGEGPSRVVAESTTNSVIFRGSPEEIQEIRHLLADLDLVPHEVVIQALFVEVDLGNTDELGVELGLQDSVLFNRSVVDNLVTITQTVSDPATGIQTTNQQIVSQTADPGFNFNNRPLGNNTAIHPSRLGTQGLSSLAVGRVNGDLGFGGLVLAAGSNEVSVLLRALAEKHKIDILSRPYIRTLDNRVAQFQIGQQVPVVEGVSITAVGSANPVIRQDQSGIILKVTPRISPEDVVMIEVTAEKSQFPGTGVPIFTDATTGRVIEAPIKDQTKANATVSVRSGQTIVLGGMITKGVTKKERKVPCLGDIPLLGHLFRYDIEQNQRKELLIFLTPRVIKSDLDAETIKEQEIGRTHFPLEDAEQIHGPIFNSADQATPEDVIPPNGSRSNKDDKAKGPQASRLNPTVQQESAAANRKSWLKRLLRR